MARIYLSDFVDVMARSGRARITKIKQLKNRPAYRPVTDFYKPLREAIVSAHSGGGGKQAVKDVLQGLLDQKKRSNYPNAVDGYLKWWKSKQIEWKPPPLRPTYHHGDMDVVVNSELRVSIDGTDHAIKLYMNSEKLTKHRADLVLGFMEFACRTVLRPGERLALLDVRVPKLFLYDANMEMTKAMVDAELDYISAIWKSV